MEKKILRILLKHYTKISYKKGIAKVIFDDVFEEITEEILKLLFPHKVATEDSPEVLECPYTIYDNLHIQKSGFTVAYNTAYDKAPLISQDRLDLNQVRVENERLKGENKRLSDRDCNASVNLCYSTEENPFNQEELKIVDVGVADNIYIVESAILTEANKQLNEHKEVVDKIDKAFKLHQRYKSNGDGYLEEIEDILSKLNKDYQPVTNPVCIFFHTVNDTSSGTKCKCGREKWEHPDA